ncbi:unnamed protein product [Adineta steineri]|uniref:Uncharacterized protein n=1 Tax=Adineta steineri TaxID=433720 RepID=A0A815DLF5_9BILA|nr:unnamed protein product [Adineta steineri]CAF1298568.1 unnamed protein product [Adineta steineri]CAF1424285.1 unnamed protein product [Adineta steineri]
MQLFSIDIHLYQLIIYLLISYTENRQVLYDNFKQHSDLFLCPYYLFRCDTTRCLPYAFVCNGEYNCHDRTDESNCSTALIDNNLCPTSYSINCEQDILHGTHWNEHDNHHEYTRPIQICIKR